MGFWPAYSEELISKYQPAEVLRRLSIAVKPAKIQPYHNERLHGAASDIFLFNGLVSKKGFSISKVVERPNNFLPLINGKVVMQNDGSRIKMQYSLFKSVNYSLAFWFFLLIGFTLISIIENKTASWIVIPIVIQVGSYALVVSRFKQAVLVSRRELVKLLL